MVELNLEPDLEPELPRPLPPLTWRDLVDRVGGGGRPARLVAGLLLAVGLVVAGWALLRTPSPPPTEVTLPFAPGASGGSAPPASTTSAPPSQLVVHAAGAVVVPGLHTLPADARVADLLQAAGGPTPDADLDRVNLAAPVADGQRVWFPRHGEPVPPEVTGGGVESPESGPVNLNTATVAELDALPGIGPAIAQAIVDHRERNGPFRSVDDLLDVRGIGEAKLAELRDLVTV